MGCDIHPIAEVKENGVWRINTDPVFKNPYYREEEKDKPNEKQWKSALKEFQSKPSTNRNYDWFAILANVRNGIGFDVIAEPRGLPDDISDDALRTFTYMITDDEEKEEEEDENGDYTYFVTKEKAEKWVKDYNEKIIKFKNGDECVTNCDYHSSSYLTIEDFDNFDWNQVTVNYGVISLEEYKRFRGTTDHPNSYCGSISGKNIITVDTNTADMVLDSDTPIELRDVEWYDGEPKRLTKMSNEWTIYVQYRFPIVYRDWFRYNIENTIEPLRLLKEKYEDARLVFAFDN